MTSSPGNHSQNRNNFTHKSRKDQLTLFFLQKQHFLIQFSSFLFIYFFLNDENPPSSGCVARSLIEKKKRQPLFLFFFSLFDQSAVCLPVYGSNIGVVFHNGLPHIAAARSQPRRSFNFARTSAASRPELIYIFINCLSLSARPPRSFETGVRGELGKLGLIAAIVAESRLITGRASPRGAAARRPDTEEGWDLASGVGWGRRRRG